MSRRDRRYEDGDKDREESFDEIKDYNDRLFKKKNKRLYIAGVVVLAFAIGFILNGSMSGMTGHIIAGNDLGGDTVGQKAIDFLESATGQTIELVSVSEESGLYKVMVELNGQEMPVYCTKDGNYIIPQVIELDTDYSGANQNNELTCADIPKENEPLLQAFVVSYCPFGIQMQRILAEIVDNIPNLAGNIEVRYMGSVVNGEVTSMHGKTEAQENLRQICIREEQSDNYWDYVSCFMKEGDSAGCLINSNIEITELESCMSSSRGIGYANEDFELADQNSVTGSPSLFMNGLKVDESGFASALGLTMRSAELIKTLICCGFSSEPSVCSQTLTSESASTGLSSTYGGSSGSGTC